MQNAKKLFFFFTYAVRMLIFFGTDDTFLGSLGMWERNQFIVMSYEL